MSSKHWLRAITAAALLGGFLAIAATTARADSVLNRGMGASPDTLDPQLLFGAREGWIQDDQYEGLVVIDGTGKILPAAAESWDIADDGKTWTFHLRAGLKWSNGDPLVAQDFVNGAIRTIDPAIASSKAYYFSGPFQVEGAKAFTAGENKDPKSVGIGAPDDRTLVIKLLTPAPNMLYLMGSFVMPPLHKASLDKFGPDFIKPENIVTNGAYVMSENVPQSHVTLVKNPNYYVKGQPYLDEIYWHVIPDAAAR